MSRLSCAARAGAYNEKGMTVRARLPTPSPKPRARVYLAEKTHAKLAPGEALRMLRDLHGMTQLELSKASRVPQATISALEAGKIGLGVERARKLAAVLAVHPAVLLFPELERAEAHAPARRGATRKTPSGSRAA